MDREELLASIARTRLLLETSIFARSSDDDAQRLIVDHNYERWVRNWDTMPVGFQKAGRLLADHLKSDDVEFDYLFAPFVYLYRHALELGLKALRRTARSHLGLPHAQDRPHSLTHLWVDIEPLLQQCNVPQAWLAGAVEPSTIRRRIEEFDRLDPQSMNFRYVDAANTLQLHRDEVVGVSNLADVVDALLGWLDGIATGISERSKAQLQA